MFLCSHMCPQHDCFPGFHSKKNSERLEGLFHGRIFLPAVLQDMCAKEAEIYFYAKTNMLCVGGDGDVLVPVSVKAPIDKL